MSRFVWKHDAAPPRHDSTGVETAFDLRPGVNMSRRRFIAMAGGTAIGFVLTRTPAAAATTDLSAAAAPEGALRPPLPCAPGETEWFSPPGRSLYETAFADLELEHLKHRG